MGILDSIKDTFNKSPAGRAVGGVTGGSGSSGVSGVVDSFTVEIPELKFEFPPDANILQKFTYTMLFGVQSIRFVYQILLPKGLFTAFSATMNVFLPKSNEINGKKFYNSTITILTGITTMLFVVPIFKGIGLFARVLSFGFGGTKKAIGRG